ncbi:MAG TPA: NAD(P)/FAD-dependent oxidoreductase [Comamonadaceae bacterium]|nr:NAD(P)/FAD-dependent oxidoreductase [Comamonadaceae bacterium]
MNNTKHLDAIVIGAGFGGMYMLKKLRDEQGLKVRVFDKAGGVGGTWYWNRYPGALSDTESFVYCYSWDKELLQEMHITTRYVTQPQILSYLEHVADRYNLRPDIQLNTGITAAHFNETTNLWEVKTDTGEAYTAKFLVTALGLLSATNVPKIKGLDTFQGEWLHTGNWPEGVQHDDKRVGVIGTGSTGTQVITAIAPKVEHLTVFQRSPQYSVPVGNSPVTPEYVAEVKKNYDEIWDQVMGSVVAFGFKESTVSAMSVSEEERDVVFQKAWDNGGGFRFMFETFCDIATDERANKAAQDFIRSKIAEIVKDPETARKLMPQDLYAKRPLCDSGYYATFNRPNVDLVDVKANPIVEITPKGVKTTDGVEHALDMLIFATGFDAVDGNYTKIDIRGRKGITIQEQWKSGPSSYMGVANANFPNMFMVLGPNGPFTNLPPSIESQVEWIAALIKDVNAKDLKTVEATTEAESGWTKTCHDIAHMTLFPKADSWIFGANIPGKTNTVYFYMAGLGAYRQELSAVQNKGYEGFVFQ